MFFNSYLIFTQIALVIILYQLVSRWVANRHLRNLLIALANIILLLNVVKEHSIIVLAVLCAVIYALALIIQKKQSKPILGISLGLVIGLFAFRNYPFLLSMLEEGTFEFIHGPIISIQKVGISYILFRLCHFLVESYKGSIQKHDPLTFLNYVFFFPSFLAGPIDRYNNFHYWIGNSRNKYRTSLFFSGVTRVLIGAFKTMAIVPLIITEATDYTILSAELGPGLGLFASLIAYSAYIYFDFSGYSDIAIGTGYMLGIRTPENFNNPYFSHNLSEFWKRWHITFSFFLRIYVFKPVLVLLNKVINPKHRMLVTVNAYLITFIICGVWHGPTLNFAVWGLWHGAGLAINKLFTTYAKPKLALANSGVYNLISMVLTFVFVTIGWMFFHYSMDQISEILNTLF